MKTIDNYYSLADLQTSANMFGCKVNETSLKYYFNDYVTKTIHIYYKK